MKIEDDKITISNNNFLKSGLVENLNLELNKKINLESSEKINFDEKCIKKTKKSLKSLRLEKFENKYLKIE